MPLCRRTRGGPWHHNEAENHLLPGVLFRKIGGGGRSWRGAWILERLWTVYRTCRKRGVEFLDVASSALQGNGYPGFGVTSGAPEGWALTKRPNEKAHLFRGGMNPWHSPWSPT